MTNNAKRRRKNKSDLGPNFVAPDGGWGWVVAIAAGFSNLSTFPVLQQFGIIFRDRLASLGITNSQITTIINIHMACTSCIGLTNGPVFRKFTYRQVAFFGGSLVTLALFLTSVANNFVSFLITFGALYGCGIGITASANSLALNTFFKEKRRMATGFSWTVTGLGPIIMPYILTYCLANYDVQGTVLLFGAFALHAVACSLIFQPVHWHTKNLPLLDGNVDTKTADTEAKDDGTFLSPKYLYNADSCITPGYEIIDPGTPMLSHANDGWFSSSNKPSLRGSKAPTPMRTPRHHRSRRSSIHQPPIASNKTSYVNLPALESKRVKQQTLKIVEFPSEEECPTNKAPHDITTPKRKKSSVTLTMPPSKSSFYAIESIPQTPKYIADNHSIHSVRKRSNTFNVEKEVLRVASKKLQQLIEKEAESHGNDDENHTAEPPQLPIDDERSADYTIWEKIYIFFDLDLLKDWSYINQMVGVTIANFSELNFSILTPFVLSDFGYTKPQIATFMSLLGAMDIIVRFCVPFIAGKIGWQNRTFFLFGVLGMAMGRVVLAHTSSYHVGLIVAGWIGMNKGLRTIFMALVIPSHVPLHKLPGATGIQLLFAGLFYLTVGPVVGYVRDATDYIWTLHFLNLTTYLTGISWGLEKLYFKKKQKEIVEDLNGDTKM